MGSGVSNLNQKGLEEVIATVKNISPDKRLNGEDVESIIGVSLFDPNDYDAVATFDEETGLHTVKQKDLLKLLIGQQVATNPDSTAATINEFEEQEAARRFRNEILSKPRPSGNSAEMRGAVWPQEIVPSATYIPILPEDADSRTKHYPYAGATVLLIQQRPEGGWNLGLFRNSKTGEWGSISSTFSERHAISQSKVNALRACAAESLNEQSCGLLHCSPSRIGNVLRDDCSVSVAFDDGEDMDSDGKPRPLMQVFLIRVEGFYREDFCHNRQVIIQNQASQPPKKAWLEMDDFTWVDILNFHNPNLGTTVADIEGQVCSCRRLVNIFNRRVISSTDVIIKNKLLIELILRFETLLLNVENAKKEKKKNKNLKYSYFEKRWFEDGALDKMMSNNLENELSTTEITEVVELRRHPRLNGGILAGGFSASLTSSDSIIRHKAT